MRTVHNGIAGVVRWTVLGLVLVSPGACADPGAIAWDAERRVNGAMAAGVALVLDDAGIPAIRDPWTPLGWPEDSLSCDGTRVAARGRGDTAYAAWWRGTPTEGPDATDRVVGDVLVVARSDNGVTWGEPQVAGHAARRGCFAPPAGIAVDGITGAAHLAYHGESAAGLGLHLVAVGVAATAPGPVLVDSGATPGSAAIAAHGDSVAVAFEAGIADSPAVWLALSLARGHIPAVRGGVSPRGVRAFAPAVALRDGRVAVAWNEPRRGTTPPAAAVRVGRILR